jgi:DNA ligase (NAD+)
LHNADEIRHQDIRAGDKVRIERAGDVIPEVVERLKEQGRARSEPFAMPEKCPVCGAGIFQEGAYHFCPGGLACRAQLEGTIIHYASRQAMNITHLGNETARALVEKNMVQDIGDLYELTIEDIKKLEGFAAKSARQLHTAIQSSKKAGLDRFLYALGIRHVGIHMAQVLARNFSCLEKLQQASGADLQKIPQVGPRIADSVSGFFRDKTNQKVLKHLFKKGIDIEDAGKKKQGPLKGLTFVFTGELETYTRSEAEQKVEAQGARATSSISSRTDYLVAGKDPGKKLKEAENKKSVSIIHEETFQKILEQGV